MWPTKLCRVFSLPLNTNIWLVKLSSSKLSQSQDLTLRDLRLWDFEEEFCDE